MVVRAGFWQRQIVSIRLKKKVSFGDLTSVFRCNFDDFRNRKILNFPTAAATSLTVEMPNDTFFFNRIDTIWRCQKPARTTIIQHFVFKNRLENLDILRGQNFYDHDHDLLTPPKIIAKWTLRTPTDSTILTVFQLDRNVVLHSSANEKSYFQFDSLTSVLPDLQAISLKK